MLGRSMITAVLPVHDGERARKFYQDKLGLSGRGKGVDGSFVMEGRGAMISLTPWPDAAPSSHTVVTFEVPDVREAVRTLTKVGVKFEDYDLPDLKTIDKVAEMGAEKAAWFKDSEGNVLCVHQSL